jgi:hypothetical protein
VIVRRDGWTLIRQVEPRGSLRHSGQPSHSKAERHAAGHGFPGAWAGRCLPVFAPQPRKAPRNIDPLDVGHTPNRRVER